jgi:hypothetical protein
MPAEGDGEIVFKHACKLGCEGVVSKRLGSHYRSGRSPHWVKVKRGRSATLAVIGANAVALSGTGLSCTFLLTIFYTFRPLEPTCENAGTVAQMNPHTMIAVNNLNILSSQKMNCECLHRRSCAPRARQSYEDFSVNAVTAL